MSKTKKEPKLLECESCKSNEQELKANHISIKPREKIGGKVICDECVMEVGYGWCDVCGEVIDYTRSWDLYTVNKKDDLKAKAQGYSGQHPQRYIVCPDCYHNFRKNEKYSFVSAEYTHPTEGMVEVTLTQEIIDKVQADLNKSPTYYVRILALKGVLDFSLMIKHTKEEKEESEKYRLARKSLDEYGFSPIDEIVVEQLNQIIDQIKNK